MRVFKKSKTWYLEYRYPACRGGKRIRERVGPNKEDALRLMGKRLDDVALGRNPELRRVHPKPFGEMVAEFLKKHASQSRDPDSFHDKARVLLRHFQGRTLQEIGTRQIDNFIAERLASGIRKSTANRYRAVLSKIFNCAIEWGYFGGENPVRRVRRFAESPGKTRWLRAEEAEALVECAPRHLCAPFVGGLHTGGRLSEILTLGWDDVDLDRGVLYFDQRNTKSGKQREIPIDPELDRVLRERRRVRLIGGDAREFVFTRYGKRLCDIRTGFAMARKRAGLGEDVTFHTLRHTFASWFMINGGDLYRLQKLLGHSTIALTQRYAHLSRGYLRDGMRFFGPPKEIGGQTVDTRANPV